MCALTRHFGLALALAVLGLGLVADEARADLLIGNLDQTDVGYYADKQIGVSIQMDGTAAPLQDIQVDERFGPVSGESMSVYSRNSNGTIGSLQFDDFSSNGGVSGITTYSALSPFTLQANTGYWFVLNSNSSSQSVFWDFTYSTSYTATRGVTIPVTNAIYTSDASLLYHNIDVGPPLFQIDTPSVTAVPEPATLVPALGGALLGLGLAWRRRRRVAAMAHEHAGSPG